MKRNNNKVFKQEIYKQMSIFDYIDEPKQKTNKNKEDNQMKANKEREIDNMRNSTVICGNCGKELNNIRKNDKRRNVEPLIKNCYCCNWCYEQIMPIARKDKKQYFAKESEEVSKLYKEADKLFIEGDFLQAIKVYEELTVKSKSKYWAYWDMYLTSCEIAKKDRSYYYKARDFAHSAIRCVHTNFMMDDIFRTTFYNYRKRLEKMGVFI